METIDTILRDVPLFEGLPDAALELIAGCGSNVHFGEGELVFRQGDPADTFFVIPDAPEPSPLGGRTWWPMDRAVRPPCGSDLFAQGAAMLESLVVGGAVEVQYGQGHVGRFRLYGLSAPGLLLAVPYELAACPFPGQGPSVLGEDGNARSEQRAADRVTQQRPGSRRVARRPAH